MSSVSQEAAVKFDGVLGGFDEKTMQVKFINDDVAIVAYKVNESLIVDGKPLPLNANDSSVWVRRNGEWLCALPTESVAGDPFGRDKSPH